MDRGVQYLSIRYTERVEENSIETSVGSRGDSYDNAMAESVIGLYKTEVIRHEGPWKGLEEVEFATLEWVDWFNNVRLLEPIGYVPPAEFEEAYYAHARCRRRRGATQTNEPPLNPGRFIVNGLSERGRLSRQRRVGLSPNAVCSAAETGTSGSRVR